MKPKIIRQNYEINSNTRYIIGWMTFRGIKSYEICIGVDEKMCYGNFRIDLAFNFSLFKKDRLFNKVRKQITCCEHLWKHWLLWQNSKRNYRDYYFYKRQRSIAIFATSFQITRMSYEQKNRT